MLDGTRSRRSATRRPLMMPADRSARWSSVCSRIWRDGGRATVLGSSVNSASVPSKSIRMIGRASWGRACQAANTRSTPRTEPRIPRFQQLADCDGGVNQSHVRIRLRKVAKEQSRSAARCLPKTARRSSHASSNARTAGRHLRAGRPWRAPRPTRTSRSKKRWSSHRNRPCDDIAA